MVGPALLGLLTTDVATVEPRRVVGIHRGVVVGTRTDRGMPPAAVHDLHLADLEALLVQTGEGSRGPARDARVDHDRSPGPEPVEPPEVDRDVAQGRPTHRAARRPGEADHARPYGVGHRARTGVGIRAHCCPVSYTHLRAHETDSYLVCRLLLEKKKKNYLL